MKKWFRKALPFLILYIAFPIFRLMMATCRVTIEGVPRFYDEAKKGKLIVALWHNRLSPIVFFLERMGKEVHNYRYCALVSKSRDGELLSRLIESFPEGEAVRIPAHGKQAALRAVLDACNQPETVVFLTPDGPRGPRYKAKPGLTYFARESEATVMPLSWSSNRYWELSSWDRFRIPKPFSKIQVTFGEPLPFSKTRRSLEEDTKSVEQALLSLDSLG